VSAAEPSYAHGTGSTPLLGDTIGCNLDRAIAAYGGREALVDVPSGRRWTYAEFGRAVDEVARGLAGRGVRKGGTW
jgi:fatty-acyl-CoA synthase